MMMVPNETDIMLAQSVDPIPGCSDEEKEIVEIKQLCAEEDQSCTTEEMSFDDSFASIASSTIEAPSKQCISFADQVEVREYNVIMGDDRQCDYPMMLSWDHFQTHATKLKDISPSYFNTKRQRPRRLTPEQRRDLLHSFGYSNSELMKVHRKRQTRLAMAYAYGDNMSLEAEKSFEAQQFHFII